MPSGQHIWQASHKCARRADVNLHLHRGLMKTIVQKIWNEPAVAIGLLASIILVLINVVADAEWTAELIIATAAPFVSSLGIRPLVQPTNSSKEDG